MAAILACQAWLGAVVACTVAVCVLVAPRLLAMYLQMAWLLPCQGRTVCWKEA